VVEAANTADTPLTLGDSHGRSRATTTPTIADGSEQLDFSG